MNFQRKLWWAQHKNDVYKYGTILSLVLIVTISIIYFTYSKFTSTNEATAYETTVEPFIKNDYFIASYVDGVWSDTIPGKDDGYVVDKIVCDNGATATWDDEEWGINVRNATQKIKCSVYFIVKPIYLRNTIQELAATDTTNFATDDPDNNIRYIGADPNNYVYFNCDDYSKQSDSTCEKWRVIGIFKNITKEDGSIEDLIKLIRNDNTCYAYYGTITWENSNIQKLLNSGAYYNRTSSGNVGTIGHYDFTKNGLKNDLTKNSIQSVVWNLGGISGSDTQRTATAEKFYNGERSDSVYSTNPATWTGKIALMYPSDYGYATAGGSVTNRETCLSTSLYSWDGSSVSDCSDNDYLYNADDEWTLTYNSNCSASAFQRSYKQIIDGKMEQLNGAWVCGQNIVNPSRIRPSLYLKSNISISGGDGSSSSPYQLKLQ